MDESCRYLFVYGTLMSGAKSALGAAERDRLAAESDSLGPASIAHAHLYDLGSYPGVATGGTADDLVHGEAVLLADPQATLKWIDAYEGIVPGRDDANEYERAVLQTRLAGGETFDAWVYLLRRAPQRSLVESGRWFRS